MSSVGLAASILNAVVAELTLTDDDEPETLRQVSVLSLWLDRVVTQHCVRLSSRSEAERQEGVVREGVEAERGFAQTFATAHRETEARAAEVVRELLRDRPVYH